MTASPIKSSCGDTCLFHTYTVGFISAATSPISLTYNLNGIDLLSTVKDFALEVGVAGPSPLLMYCTLITISFGPQSHVCSSSVALYLLGPDTYVLLIANDFPRITMTEYVSIMAFITGKE